MFEMHRHRQPPSRFTMSSSPLQFPNGVHSQSPPPPNHFRREVGGGKWNGECKVKGREKRRRERINSELLVAVLQKNLAEVKRILRKNEAFQNAYCRDSKATAVHLASFHGLNDILDALFEAGAQPNAPDAFGRRPVHLAAWAGWNKTVELLIQLSSEAVNAVVDCPEGYVWSPEDEDNWNHKHDEVSKMLPLLVKGETSLHVATKFLNKEMVLFLLDKGADPEIRDRNEQTPLDVAGILAEGTDTSGSLYAIVKALEEKGCFVNKSTELDGSTNRDTTTNTLLHTAVIKEDIQLIDSLIEKGADPLVLDANGDTPVHVAVKKRLFESLTALLSWLDVGGIDAINRDGQTALHIAVENEWANGVGRLLESGSDVRVKNNKKETAIHIASQLGNPMLLRELLQVDGALEVVDKEDGNGFAPIFRAIKENSHECVKVLMEFGNANVFQIMKDDINVLHYTALHGRVPIMKYLLRYNEVTQKLMNKLSLNMNGRAPLHLAAELGKVKSVKELINAGADPKMKTTEKPGMRTTAAHLAARAGYENVVETLLDKDTTCLFVRDMDGWLPLHSAAASGHGKVVEVMIKRGANVADTVSWQGTVKTAMDLIASRVPNSEDLFQDLLDSYVTLSKDTVQKKSDNLTIVRDPSTEIHVHFDMFLGIADNDLQEGKYPQLTFFSALLNTKNDDLKERTILHPLVEIFLYYKWSKMWKFFICLLLLYGAHTFAVTCYSISTFITPPEGITNQTSSFPISLSRNFVQITLIPISIAELLQAMSVDRFYFSEGETWIKWSLIASSAVLVVSPSDAGDWVKNSASIAVLLTWIELLLLLGRFQMFGLHVIMFEKVAINVCKVLLKFLLLFLGFTFALMIQFGGKWPFEGLIGSITQILVMTVELNYGGVFDADHADNLPGRVLFVAFMVVIAIILTNLTVGIAVNDVQDLEKQGKAELLAKKASFLSFLESVVYNERLICFFPKWLKDKLNQLRFVELEKIIYPNKPCRIPSNLKTNLLKRINRTEDDETITREYFNKRLDKLSRQIESIRNAHEQQQKFFQLPPNA